MPASSRATGATGTLARHAASLRFDDLPPEVVAVAKQCVLDVLGVAIAGVDEPVARLVHDVTMAERASGSSSLLGRPGQRTSAGAAALVNGTAAHALDYDDVLTSMTAHPSAPVVPAVLALAEERHASGRSLLEAFVSGYEVEGRIGTAVAPSHYRRGFHATGTVGTFGAAAATARLLGLGAEETATALGIAGAQAAGLKCEFGTMTKPLHAGKAAANGLFASRLAARGFTSARDVIGCEQGFGATQADSSDPDVLTAPFGAPWYVLQTLFKLHASCHYTHSIFDALEAVRDAVTVEEVDRVEVRVHPDLLAACGIPMPETGLEGKFSMAYVAALALAYGSADPSWFTDEAVRAPLLRELCEKVEIAPSADVHPFSSECVVEMVGGGVATSTASSDQPSWTDHPDEQYPALLSKFTALVEPVLGPERTRLVAGSVAHLEEVDDVSVLLGP